MIKKTIFFFIFFIGICSFSQTLLSRVEKNTVALGEPNVMQIKINNLLGKPVISAPKNKLLPFHFEIIKDSIFNKQDTYERTIEFAIFQEGKFTIPALEFKIGNTIQKTIPYEVEAVNTAKKEDKINDIMSNKEVTLGLRDYWQLYKWWLLIGIAVLGIIFLIFVFLRYGRKIKNSPQSKTNHAVKSLQLLKNKKYIESGNHRAFYVELIEIMRNFLSQQYRIPADVLLTDDLIAYIKQNHSVSQQNEAIVEDVFLRGDLVKFAKIFPSKEMMENDWTSCINLVKDSIKDIEFENLRKDV